MLIIVGIYISTFIAINIHITTQQKLASIKYDHFYDIELVPNKPQSELIVYPDHVNIYNHPYFEFKNCLKNYIMPRVKLETKFRMKITYQSMKLYGMTVLKKQVGT